MRTVMLALAALLVASPARSADDDTSRLEAQFAAATDLVVIRTVAELPEESRSMLRVSRHTWPPADWGLPWAMEDLIAGRPSPLPAAQHLFSVRSDDMVASLVLTGYSESGVQLFLGFRDADWFCWYLFDSWRLRQLQVPMVQQVFRKGTRGASEPPTCRRMLKVR